MAELYKKHILKGITDEEVERRLAAMRPVIDKGGTLHYLDIAGVDRWSTAYLWEPKVVEPAPNLIRTPGGGRQWTVHTFGAPALWKPTLGEVVAQINPTWFESLGVIAFSLDTPQDTTFQFCTLTEDGAIVLRDSRIQRLELRSEALHFGVCTLYVSRAAEEELWRKR